MNEKLISWIKEIHLEPTEDFIKKRESGIDAWIKSYEKKDYNFLISYILCDGKCDAAQLEKFTDAIKTHDKLFVPEDCDREIHILISVAFSKLIDLNNKDSMILALAYITASFGKKMNVIPQKNLFDLSVNFINQFSVNQKVTVIEKTKSVQNNSEFEKIRTGLKENPNLPINSFLEVILKKIDSHYDSILISNEIIDKLRVANIKLADEVDILWWAFSGLCSLLDTSYSKLNKYESCLIIGYELYELIKVTPGPISITSIIERQLFNCKNVDSNEHNFTKSITNLDDKLIDIVKNRIGKFNDFKMILPIHVAIQRYDFAGRRGGWFSAYCKDYEVKINKDISLALIAKQFNYECQLLALFEN